MESITGEGLASADRRLESVSEGSCLGGRQLDHKSATTLQGNAHDDATSFLGHLERTIARPWLHGGHARAPSLVQIKSLQTIIAD
jgi:hypothetical protein